MKFPIDTILPTTAVISLIGGILNINPSSAATIGYDLKFFDNLDNQVGSGEFTYDSHTSTCIQTQPFGDSCDQVNGFFVNTELVSFSANISGTEWIFDDRSGQLWWDEQSNSVRGTIASRSDILLGEQWFFGDQFFNENFLSIEGQSGGTWTQVLNDSNFVDGIWIATAKDSVSPDDRAVPEPLTLLGAGVAIGFGTFFKIKLK
ncbi:MAG: PEP-CTERM sorting domain-containing protein [Crocosphaera sp.]|nr:PEP-CTERM sorting domain-containing protein [Crocosphaera sp.]